MNGILPLWKPKGMTSHDCVIKARKCLETKKVGHTGTLDPEVEGVLPLCVGQATKIVPYLTDTNKTYVAEISLGYSTETEDSHGGIVEKKAIADQISITQIEKVLQQFIGDLNQIPPMYSAVKVNGRKLYDYARKGEYVERPQREIVIYDIKLESNQIIQNDERLNFTIEVECSKGTYIRTLCVDIGKALGYPAHMSGLERVKTGDFERKNTHTFEEIMLLSDKSEVEQLLLPIQAGVTHLDVVYVNEKQIQRILYGQKLKAPEQLPVTNPFRVQWKDRLLALYQLHPKETGIMKPVRVFN